MTIEDLIREAIQRPKRRVRFISLARDGEGRWQGNVSYDGDAGAYRVRVCADPIEALTEALATDKSAMGEPEAAGVFD